MLCTLYILQDIIEGSIHFALSIEFSEKYAFCIFLVCSCLATGSMIATWWKLCIYQKNQSLYSYCQIECLQFYWWQSPWLPLGEKYIKNFKIFNLFVKLNVCSFLGDEIHDCFKAILNETLFWKKGFNERRIKVFIRIVKLNVCSFLGDGVHDCLVTENLCMNRYFQVTFNIMIVWWYWW